MRGIKVQLCLYVGHKGSAAGFSSIAYNAAIIFNFKIIIVLYAVV